MQYRQLGNSGVRVSVIGMGTNQFGKVVAQEAVHEIIAAGLSAGFDHTNLRRKK